MKEDRNPSYSERIVRLVRQDIRDGKLRGGDRISELSLADEYGVSRSPVREALAQLEADGFIMPCAKRGKCVTILTPEEILNRYELSGIVEGAATAKVALRARQEGYAWPELGALLECMRLGPQDEASFEKQADLGTEFHTIILKRADNTLLSRLSTKLCRIISKYLMFQQWRTLYTSEELYQRHALLYGMMSTGSAREIEEAVRVHYQESAERLAALCEQPRRASLPRAVRKAHFLKNQA